MIPSCGLLYLYHMITWDQCIRVNLAHPSIIYTLHLRFGRSICYMSPTLRFFSGWEATNGALKSADLLQIWLHFLWHHPLWWVVWVVSSSPEPLAFISHDYSMEDLQGIPAKHYKVPLPDKNIRENKSWEVHSIISYLCLCAPVDEQRVDLSCLLPAQISVILAGIWHWLSPLRLLKSFISSSCSEGLKGTRVITGPKGYKMKAQSEDTNMPTEHKHNAYNAIGWPEEMPL